MAIKGELPDIGKNLVTTMLTGVGFEVRDIGINVPTDEIIRATIEFQPDILGLSALLTTTMPEMKKIIDALVARGLKSEVKVIGGGAPVNEKFARDIGSDGYAQDAGGAVTLAKKLMEHPPSD
jgi:5-methyltetrahydrofolate--homocysteine methyltransferase